MENSLLNLMVYQVALEISDLSFEIFEKIPNLQRQKAFPNDFQRVPL